EHDRDRDASSISHNGFLHCVSKVAAEHAEPAECLEFCDLSDFDGRVNTSRQRVVKNCQEAEAFHGASHGDDGTQRDMSCWRSDITNDAIGASTRLCSAVPSRSSPRSEPHFAGAPKSGRSVLL